MVMDDPQMVKRVPLIAPRLLIHVPAQMLEKHGQGGFGLYSRIAPHFRKQGVEVTFLERPATTELTGYTKEDFHIVHHGFLRRFNVLNCGVAYVWPFWHLDPRGVLCDSSMANAQPDFDSIEPEAARQFFEALRRRMVETGASKYDQPKLQGALAEGHIAVFLQGMGDPVLRNMYMLETEMLELVMRYRAGREVLIKRHPKWPDTLASAHAERLAERDPGVRMVDANIHDMLDGAYCSVSICSGAAFEGFFHRVPAVIFGRSDFKACAWTVRNAGEAERAFAEIGGVAYDYERFLYWFLRRKMFNSRNPNVGARVMQRIERTGFEFLPASPAPDPLLAGVAESPGKAPLKPSGKPPGKPHGRSR